MKKAPVVSLVLPLCLIVCISVASCSGGGSGMGFTPPPPVPVSISISPTSATVQSGNTQQFTATVTGSTNTAVTWLASSGTISSSGLYTAPSVGTNTSATITATAKADTFKSASASVTVTPAPRTITSLAPEGIFFDGDLPVFRSVQVNGTGFLAGDHGKFSPALAVTGAQLVSEKQIVFSIGLDTQHWSPGWFSLQICNSDESQCSNTADFAFWGNQNTLTSSGTELFQLDQAQDLPAGQNGFVRKFTLSGVADGNFFVGALNLGLSFDSSTNNLSFSAASGRGIAIRDANGNLVNSIAAGTVDPVAIAAQNGVTCFTQPTSSTNGIGCFDGLQATPAITFAAAGQEAFSLAITPGCGGNDAFILDRQGNGSGLQLSRFGVSKSGGVATITPAGSLTLAGFTPADTLRAALPSSGGWQIAVLDSGTHACTVAVMAPILNADQSVSYKLGLVDGTTMQQIGSAIALPANSFRIAADNTHQAFIVANADAPAALTRFTKVDAATGITTQLSATTPLLAVGLLVSADGTKIYAAQRDQLTVLNNQ
jgi:Bacterial Ig-like domain (group 2)